MHTLESTLPMSCLTKSRFSRASKKPDFVHLFITLVHSISSLSSYKTLTVKNETNGSLIGSFRCAPEPYALLFLYKCTTVE